MSAVLEQTIETGVADAAPNAGPTARDDIERMSAVRWVFNPAAKIDVRDRVIGYERGADGQPVTRRFIRAGVLTPLRNVTRNVPPQDAKNPTPRLGDTTPIKQRLVAVTKYAVEVAMELQDAYSDTGLVVVDALTGVEDESVVAGMLKLCLGPKVKAASDPALPGEVVPNIPQMLAELTRNAAGRISKAFEKREDPALEERVEALRSALAASCRQGMSWAQGVTAESRRLLKSRTPNGGTAKIEFDARDRRCFLALGERVPEEIQGSAAPVQQQDTAAIVEKFFEREDKRNSEVDELRETVRKLTATVEQMAQTT